MELRKRLQNRFESRGIDALELSFCFSYFFFSCLGRPWAIFSKQVITNACATQAILSVLLNATGINIGPKLAEFRDFTQAFDSEMKGEAISNSDMIKEAHNSFARPEPFCIDDSKLSSGKGDAYHFIAFVPHEGAVYEIDGLKRGPIKLGQHCIMPRD